jgi:hypothetical protein
MFYLVPQFVAAPPFIPSFIVLSYDKRIVTGFDSVLIIFG